MAIDPVLNFAKVTVNAGYASGETAIALSGGHGAKLPDPAVSGAFNLVWWNFTDYPDPSDDPDVEIVRCTARTTDTLTVTRAQEGTSDANHNTGGKTYKMLLAFTKLTYDAIGSKLLFGVDKFTVSSVTVPQDFNTTAVFIASSTLVFLNGIFQEVSINYTEKAGLQAITFLTTIEIGDKIEVRYAKY